MTTTTRTAGPSPEAEALLSALAPAFIGPDGRPVAVERVPLDPGGLAGLRSDDGCAGTGPRRRAARRAGGLVSVHRTDGRTA